MASGRGGGRGLAQHEVARQLVSPALVVLEGSQLQLQHPERLQTAAAVQVPIYLSDISITAGLTLHTNAMACNEQLFSLYTAGSAACAYACACADQW